MAFSLQYSMRNEVRQSGGRWPPSSGTSERPCMCGPGVPPASATMVGAMSIVSTSASGRLPAAAGGG